MLIAFLVWIVKYLEKKLPERDKRQKELWELEQDHKETVENSYEKEDNKHMISVTEVANHFKISPKELNKIFQELEWIYKKDKWWIANEIGKKQGAKEYYDTKRKTKYIKWNSQIKNNIELINKIHSKDIKPYERKTSNQDKKNKGNSYETYIANFFKAQGYYVWEHGKEKGVKDSSIDLIIKKDKYIFFVQCKNWEKWKINHKEVKATRTDVREYLKKEKEFWNLIKSYNPKILYVTPKRCLSKSAYTYIKENSDIVEYKVIPIEN